MHMQKGTAMGKKKKRKHTNEFSILQEVDNNLDLAYDELMKDIRHMQTQLMIADTKAKKRLKKKKKKDPYHKQLYNNDSFRAYTRQQILQEMETTNFLDRVERMLRDIVPVVIIMARLVASLILSILSMDIVRLKIQPQTLSRLDTIYKMAMAIG